MHIEFTPGSGQGSPVWRTTLDANKVRLSTQ